MPQTWTGRARHRRFGDVTSDEGLVGVILILPGLEMCSPQKIYLQGIISHCYRRSTASPQRRNMLGSSYSTFHLEGIDCHQKCIQICPSRLLGSWVWDGTHSKHASSLILVLSVTSTFWGFMAIVSKRIDRYQRLDSDIPSTDSSNSCLACTCYHLARR